MMKAYVYMLRCGDGSLYTGWTNDPEKRLHQIERDLGNRSGNGGSDGDPF